MARLSWDRWITRLVNALTLWGLLPPTVVGLVTAYLASGVSWVGQWGAFGWFIAGLVGFFLAAAGMALAARAKLWRIDARVRDRLAADSSPFDPMASVYEKKRLYLRDLAPAGRLEVRGKRFINCEIIGPGNIVLAIPLAQGQPAPAIRGITVGDGVDCVQISGAVVPRNAIRFSGCDFIDCGFFHLSMLFIQRIDDSLHWITPDFRQPPLLPAPPPQGRPQ